MWQVEMEVMKAVLAAETVKHSVSGAVLTAEPLNHAVSGDVAGKAEETCVERSSGGGLAEEPFQRAG